MVIVLLLSLAAGHSRCQESRQKQFQPGPIFQFAGGIGMVSLGLGHSYLDKKGETHILGGYVPKSKAGRTLWILTVKQAYFPFKIKLAKKAGRSYHLYPIAAGVLISMHNLGSQNELPFYFNSMMYGYFIRSKVQVKLKDRAFKFVDLYCEVGSNFVETRNHVFNNSTIKLGDIINIGLGISLHR